MIIGLSWMVIWIVSMMKTVKAGTISKGKIPPFSPKE